MRAASSVTQACGIAVAGTPPGAAQDLRFRAAWPPFRSPSGCAGSGGRNRAAAVARRARHRWRRCGRRRPRPHRARRSTPGWLAMKSATAWRCGAGNIQQENVGHSGRRAAADLAHQRVLHQEHGEGEHHAHAQRDHRGLRLVAGPVEVGDAMAQHAGQGGGRVTRAAARTPRSSSQAAAESSARPTARPAAKIPPVRSASRKLPSGERGRHGARAQQDGSARSAPGPAIARAAPALVRGHIAAEDFGGPDGADAQQRRQGEQERHQAGDGHALHRGPGIPGGRPPRCVK